MNDPFVMRKHCGNCAFVAGTEANRAEHTTLIAQLCVMASEPFYCHRAKDGELEARIDHRGEPVLCRGFVDALAARGQVPDWHKAIAVESLRILQDAKDGKVITPDEATARTLAAGKAVA